MIKLSSKSVYKIGKWAFSIGSILYIVLKLKAISIPEFELLLTTFNTTTNYILLLFLLSLMFLNWTFEALKWKIVLVKLQVQSFNKSFKSVLVGVAIGIITPNRVGELVGRLLYIDDHKKIPASFLNILCSISQLMVTLVFGAIAIVLFKDNWLSKIPFSSLFSIISLLLIILASALFLITKNKFIKKILIDFTKPLRSITLYVFSKLMVLSMLRYLVFSLQYFLVLKMFNLELSAIDAFVCIALNFFLITIIPTFALAEIGVRGTVAIAVFSVYNISSLPVLSASLIIWIVNLAIPALLGSIILLRERE